MKYHNCNKYSAGQWTFVEFSECSSVNFPMNASELNVCSTRTLDIRTIAFDNHATCSQLDVFNLKSELAVFPTKSVH